MTLSAIAARRIWTESGWLDEGALAIEQGRIAWVGPRSDLPRGIELFDAGGLTVLPGLIDTHSHHREPGFEHKESIRSATAAAAAGGVTVSIGMPNLKPPVTDTETLRSVLDRYAAEAIVDYNVNPAATRLDAIPALAEAGCLGFKIWMVVDTKRSYPHMPGLGVHDDGDLLEIFETVAGTGRPLMVHPHNQELMTLFERRSWARGETGPEAYARAQRAYDGIVWDTAVATLLRLQEAAATRLHVLHLVTERSIELVRAAKTAGRQVTAEVNGFALFLGSLDLIREKGPYVLGRWIPRATRERLWAALADGTIDLIGTDHAPHTREEKELGWQDMWKAPSGTPQLEHYLSKLLTAVNDGVISLDAAVRATSLRPAQIFGLYPRKGTIAAGADADLVLVDTEARRRIGLPVQSACGWTPYDGDDVVGVPVHTILRGEFVMRDGRVVGRPGQGRPALPADQAT